MEPELKTREDQEFFFFGEEEINTCLYTQKISFRDESTQTFTFLEIKLIFLQKGTEYINFFQGGRFQPLGVKYVKEKNRRHEILRKRT